MSTLMNRERVLGCGLLAFSLVLMAPVAHANESEATRLFREGRALMLQDRFDEACPKIAESQRLEPHVGTLLNLAACHEGQGKIGTAWVEFQKALTAARAEGQVDRERFAQERIDVLEPRVPWLAISVKVGVTLDGLEVTLDGATIAPVAWGKEMPVDPGAHSVAATAPRLARFEERFELHESEHKAVTIAMLDSSIPPMDAKPAPLVVEPTTVPPASPRPAEHRRWVLETGLFVGLVHLDAGIPRDPDTTVGVNLFAGAALSDELDLGARLFIGPLVHGGTVGAFGPSVFFHPGGPLRIGASLLLGAVKISGPWTSSSGDSAWMQRDSTDLAGGFGCEVDWRLIELSRGSIALTLTPFYLLGKTYPGSGTASAWALPLGVSYRYQ